MRKRQARNENEWQPIEAMKVWVKNPRKNDGPPVEHVEACIRRFGFINPIVIWRARGRMVAGHTRLKAMQKILTAEPKFVPKGAPGPGLVRVIFHDFLNEDEANAYAVADNKTGELASFDEVMLAAQLADMRTRNVSMVGMGFQDWQLTKMLQAHNKPVIEVVPEPPKVATTKLGDLWILGESRLLCGDSTDTDTVTRLMDGTKADLLWTDPPYNVAIAGLAGTEEGRAPKTKGHHVRKGNAIANDTMGSDQFRAFLTKAFTNATQQMNKGAAFYITHADIEAHNFQMAIRDPGVAWHFAQNIIWVKSSFVLGRLDYHSRHEPMAYGWKMGAAHHAVKDRSQDTVWPFDRPSQSLEHPTMKPVELVEKSILNSTDRGGVVLDLFGGSGTTLSAAVKNERRALLCELDPRCCDVIVERWQRQTGGKAVLVGGGGRKKPKLRLVTA